MLLLLTVHCTKSHEIKLSACFTMFSKTVFEKKQFLFGNSNMKNSFLDLTKYTLSAGLALTLSHMNNLISLCRTQRVPQVMIRVSVG